MTYFVLVVVTVEAVPTVIVVVFFAVELTVLHDIVVTALRWSALRVVLLVRQDLLLAGHGGWVLRCSLLQRASLNFLFGMSALEPKSALPVCLPESNIWWCRRLLRVSRDLYHIADGETYWQSEFRLNWKPLAYEISAKRWPFETHVTVDVVYTAPLAI